MASGNLHSWGLEIELDQRVLTGEIFFRRRNGALIAPVTAASVTQYDPETGELVSISPEDVQQTEVHFFREDNLEEEIARLTFAHANIVDPESGQWFAPQHGQYRRIRFGPPGASSTQIGDTDERPASD